MVLDSNTVVAANREELGTPDQPPPPLSPPSSPVLSRAPSEPSNVTETIVQHREAKVSAMSAVRDLLHRKEQLVLALAKMNAQARAEKKAGPSDKNGNGTRRGRVLVLPATDRSTLQRQYEWVVRNLDATNRSLQDALLLLQECSRDALVRCASHSGVVYRIGVYSSYTLLTDLLPPLLSIISQQPLSRVSEPPPASSPRSQAWSAKELSDSVKSLSLEQTKWALAFLAGSRKRARDLVDETMTHMVRDGTRKRQHPPSEAAGMPGDAGDAGDDDNLSFETRELVSTCLCFMSAVRGGGTGAIPPVVAQKLIARLLELLEPQHDANMDLYAEMRSASEGVQTILQAATASTS